MLTIKVAFLILAGGFLQTRSTAMMVTNKTVQALPETCGTVNSCPDNLQDLQASCCGNMTIADNTTVTNNITVADNSTELTVHCQEQDVNNSLSVIIACLPTATCEAGTYAKIYQEKNGNQTVAWTDCLPCDANTFQPQPHETKDFRHDRCVENKTLCTGVMVERIVVGGTTMDDRCRCDSQKGYAPLNTTGDKCLNFTKGDNCRCGLHNCSEGQFLNTDYVCENMTTTTTESTTDNLTPTTPGTNVTMTVTMSDTGGSEARQPCTQLECSRADCDRGGCIILIATLVFIAVVVAACTFSVLRKRLRN